MGRKSLAEATTAQSLEFERDPASVPAARRFVRDTLRGWELGGAEYAAVQLTSELTTNSLLHARSGFSVRVIRRPDALRVEVLDRSAVLPQRRSFSVTATTGRGVRLLDAYGLRWGAEPLDRSPYRKRVWVDVSLHADSAAEDEYATFDAVAGMDWSDAEL